MNIKGGTGVTGSCGNPFDPQDESVFVSKVSPEGAVHRDGRIKLGMRIVEVNGHSLLGASHDESVDIIKKAGNSIMFIVCDGYNNMPGAALHCQVRKIAIAKNEENNDCFLCIFGNSDFFLLTLNSSNIRIQPTCVYVCFKLPVSRDLLTGSLSQQRKT